jgi:hypothetical protein
VIKRVGYFFQFNNTVLSINRLTVRAKLLGGTRGLCGLLRVHYSVRSRKLSNIVIGWVTKNLLSRAPPCFRRHVKPLVLAAFAVVSTHQATLGPRGGLWPVVLMCSVSQQWINRLMMKMRAKLSCCCQYITSHILSAKEGVI